MRSPRFPPRRAAKGPSVVRSRSACGPRGSPQGRARTEGGLSWKRSRTRRRAYLEHRGFEIIEKGWAHGDASVDYVSGDDNGGFPGEPVDREASDRLAIAYLADHPESGDCIIRFDSMSLVAAAADDDQALLRYHRNALCAVE